MLSMAEPQPSGGEDDGGFSCIFIDCDVKNNSSCITTCVFSGQFLSPLPPSPVAGKSTQSHLAPFLIAAVCILGISFLLLTTFTIILRYRFSRRWRNASVSSDSFPADDGGDSAVDHPIWLITTVGLPPSVIDSITAFKYSKLDGILIDGSDCSVCLTEFEDGDDLRLLPKCSHAFHLPCIDTWLRSHKNCPLCRAPVANDAARAANFSLSNLSSSNLDEDYMDNAENNERGLVLTAGGGECSPRLREGVDVLVVDLPLPIEGVKLAQILKKNRELRILSDLGDIHRSRSVKDGDDRIKRSISFNSSASLAIHRDMDNNVCSLGSEGSSSNNYVLVEEKEIDFDHNVEAKRGSSMSGLSMTTSSIGRSLQNGSESMKRSFSSSKLFSFRRSKSQASILPL